VLTWPVVDRNWGSPWRDIAYTNWGFKSPGGWVAGEAEKVKAAESGVGMGGMGYGSGGGAVGAPMKKKASKLKVMSKTASPSMDKKDSGVYFDSLADSSVDGDLMMEGEDMEMAGEERSRSRDQAGRRRKVRPRKITIRTRFPETALWEPLLKTAEGTASLSVTFPDAITVQRLTLVASDKLGGVGILHQDVEVRQDLFVQSDLPAR